MSNFALTWAQLRGYIPRFLLDFFALLQFLSSSFFFFFSLLCPFNTDVANWVSERERDSANIPLLLLFPFTPASSLAHERGRPRPVDGRWGVCYARAPDPDTTQHTALQATTAGLECDLLQTRALCVCVCVCVCVCSTSGEGRRRTWMEGCQLQNNTCTGRMSLLISWGSMLGAQQHHEARTRSSVWSIIFIHSAIMFHQSLNEN